MHIAIVEPFYSGSHKTWVDDLCRFLNCKTSTFTLPGRHWKWRMAAGAIELAEKVNVSNVRFDVMLVTDMLDVALFKALLQPEHQSVRFILYMHENQVVYPYQTADRDKNRDRHYGLINYKSILTVDHIWFNSKFHKDVFFKSLQEFLSPFPEASFHVRQAKNCIAKSKIIPLGIDCEALDKAKVEPNKKPTILWNHRWEYDKNPEAFFNTVHRLSKDGVHFDLIVVGEQYSKSPEVFQRAEKQLSNHIVHWGFVSDKTSYHKLLWQANILPVTTNQEFFGLSVLEAIYCQATPLLPKRLSYPDLYNELDVFYNDDEELYQKLKAIITTKSYDQFQDKVAQYDWRTVAKIYEAELLKVIT